MGEGEQLMAVDFLNLGGQGQQPVRNSPYDFDYFVIGGGSGGLASAKQAADLGAKVALADFVSATPINTTWGLGGTCVNVGCIPKKMMHYSAYYGEHYRDQIECGWDLPPSANHSWQRLVSNVQTHISTLNWGYRMQLIDKNITYFNFLATFIDTHTVSLCDASGVEKKRVTAQHFLVAVGGRPMYGDFPGAKECCFTSDDLFSMKNISENILVVGASYISLECAGFLNAFGKRVTVMVRSIFLRGFDQDMASKIGEHMGNHGIRFYRNAVPIEFQRTGENQVLVRYNQDGEIKQEVFGGVLLAIGRQATTNRLNLESVGVNTNPRNQKILTNELDQSSTPNIWAVGDVADGRLELTPTAISAGNLLARRLFSNSQIKMDYRNIPTTVFTPLQYSCCGYSEEEALEEFGVDRIEVYHTAFTPLEWNFLESRKNETCYAKVIVDLENNEKVIGIHYLGPNAGEIMQGFAVAIKAGVTKEILQMTVGIHPTVAEELVKVKVTKRSGETAEKSGCWGQKGRIDWVYLVGQQKQVKAAIKLLSVVA